MLPTGTGKTETMLATQVYVCRRLDRSLVLVPSDALRRQIAWRFWGNIGGCGCRHGGYTACGAAGTAGSDCIHNAGELKFQPVGWIYQDHFLQADFPVLIGSHARISIDKRR